MSGNLVSIIVPAYNSCKYISNAIVSVQAQTYSEWEMLIVDDCSTDGTAFLIENFVKQDSRIKFIMHPKNMGVAAARNTAIENSNGRYISFLDSDDEWLPDKLNRQVSYMLNNNIYFCYSSYEVMNEMSQIIATYKIPKNKVSYSELLKGCIIGNLTAIYDVRFFGKKPLKNIGHEDYILWLELLKQVDFAYGLDEPLARYRVSRKSISGNKLRSARWQWRIYREVEKFNFLKSCYYFLHYTINGLMKYK